MPKRSIRCRQIRQQGGTIFARFSDESELEFKSRAEIKRWIAERLSDEVVKALLLAVVLEDAADGVPLSDCDGKRVTLDWAAVAKLMVEVAP